MTSEVGVTVEGQASVHDIRYSSGDRTVVAYLVLPIGRPASAGVLFFHWLSSSGGDRGEFRSEAVGLAGQGVASLLVQGVFPWSTNPSGADHDKQAIADEVAGLKAGVDLLLQQPGITVPHLAFVGHDYGAMHGAVLLAQETRFAGAVLMAPDAHWSNWFNDFFNTPPSPGDRAAYAAALQPLDATTVLRSIHCKVLLQFASSDEFLPVDRAHEVEAAVPAALRTTMWYASDHGFNDAARSDRDSWMLGLL